MGPIISNAGPLGKLLVENDNPFSRLFKPDKAEGALGLSTAVARKNQGRTQSVSKFRDAIENTFPEVLGGGDTSADTSPWAGLRTPGPHIGTASVPSPASRPTPEVSTQTPAPGVAATTTVPSGTKPATYPDGTAVPNPDGTFPDMTPHLAPMPGTTAQTTKTGSAPVAPSLRAYRQAIKDIESNGGNYKALGPVTEKGDRAYGAYQVMGSNIPSWTKEVLGRAYTPEEFLNDEAAQDAVFDYQFGKSIQRHGTPQDAASVWFTGRPTSSASAGGSKDILGTSGNEYVRRFNNALSTNKRSAPPGIGPGVDTSQPTIDLGGGPQFQAKQPLEPWQEVLEAYKRPAAPAPAEAPKDPAAALPEVKDPMKTSEGERPMLFDKIIEQIKTDRSTVALKGLDRTNQIALLMRAGQLERKRRGSDNA